MPTNKNMTNINKSDLDYYNENFGLDETDELSGIENNLNIWESNIW